MRRFVRRGIVRQGIGRRGIGRRGIGIATAVLLTVGIASPGGVVTSASWQDSEWAGGTVGTLD
ncbi:hypothetical protein [Gulosibacter molinativorax]|uniref:Uncharacterized protein n=1 Tax=Gulosibacter molinativorax TaxID=256821 RepID=A0ABT7C6Y8_9MICO|nr:hypothetical protein [Gulosibacter molinativorax]MDJ1370967.1 hypothetical protein [Gulosibacter molinativorax]QUY62758.1 Hypotetical protein [Gulosibacter molinativorax]